MFMTDEQSAELSQPGVCAFDNPASFVASQFPAIFVSPLLVVLSVRRDQLDTAPFPSLAQWIGVVTPVRDHPFWLLPRPTFRPGDADLFERGAPSKVRQALSQMPSSSHCFSRRQQIDGEGYSSGRKRHAAPVCRTHRIPSKHARFSAHGRPRLSFLRRGSGNKGPINSHCSSLNSFCRFFMTEAQQFTCLIRKSLI
jgi:hypothetical protein